MLFRSIDPECIDITKEKIDNLNNIEFIKGDVLKVGFPKDLQHKFQVVANIPYYISAKIIKLLISNRERLSKAYIMVQKEFAEKLLAKPGEKDYTSLSVFTSYYMSVTKEFLVSKHCFKPEPKVDSAVISLQPKKIENDIDEEIFFSIIQSAFWGRRKTLMTCLSKSPFITFDKSFKEIAFFQKEKQRRGETLSLDEFKFLYTQLKPFVKAINPR